MISMIILLHPWPKIFSFIFFGCNYCWCPCTNTYWNVGFWPWCFGWNIQFGWHCTPYPHRIYVYIHFAKIPWHLNIMIAYLISHRLMYVSVIIFHPTTMRRKTITITITMTTNFLEINQIVEFYYVNNGISRKSYSFSNESFHFNAITNFAIS